MPFLIISLLFVIIERLLPRRAGQGMLREGIATDLLHWGFNGYLFYLGYSIVTGFVFQQFTVAMQGAGLGDLLSLRLLTGQSLWLQFIILFLAQDFLMWCTHNLLHRVPFLWELHRVHHSIETMDWIGNMRYHWGEIVVYNLVMFFPLMVLGADPVLFIYIGVFNTFIGHFNHSNLRVNIGPLKYLFNSPEMHLWHHDKDGPASHNKNFAIGLSLWDWIFRTAYLPKKGEPQEPRALGFAGIEEFPRSFWRQQTLPISRSWRRTTLLTLLLTLFNVTVACDAQTRNSSMVVDSKKKTVSFGGTIHPKQYNSLLVWPKHHHFIVWKGGRAAGKALVQADVNDLEVQRGLESLGAVAGNNLTTDSWDKRGDRRNPEPDKRVEGTAVDVAIAWEGHAPVHAGEIFIDKGGKGFQFRFGGHEKLIPEWKSGCIVCLESCPGGRVSNASYTLRDYETGTAKFDLRKAALPKDGTKVTIILTLR